MKQISKIKNITMKLLHRLPLLNKITRWGKQDLGLKEFSGSQNYWEQRYAAGGNSGAGSYGKFAEFKSDTLNNFVHASSINTVIEFGCGDGNQLSIAEYPEYLGLDVSNKAIELCRERFGSDHKKSFQTVDAYQGETAELSLSLDVIYHLVEDPVFELYMHQLFDAASRFVIIYASDSDNDENAQADHVRHRKFTAWIDSNIKNWSLKQKISNKYPYDGDHTQGSFADFYIYERVN